ncbi:hypothetical protein Taro_001582 [Colocasia esculenta]|uniref:Uncharacterized protein n=1 Tax=Colocasia esculenta TaxID=4460 RepID=A0A843TBH2_COLES|nr:hypothetical protein [Colocasia esculenta]
MSPSQVRPRMTHTLMRKGMTKSEARSTIESLCYLRVVVESEARNQRLTSAKYALDGIHWLDRLGSLYGEKQLSGHLGLSRPMLHLRTTMAPKPSIAFLEDIKCTVSQCKVVNFEELKEKNLDIKKMIKGAWLLGICSSKQPIYPELIKEFYFNLVALKNEDMYTSIKNQKIGLTEEKLVKYFKCSSIENSPSSKIPQKEIYEKLIEQRAHGANIITQLSTLHRLLHKLCCVVITPSGSSHATVTKEDALVIYGITIG